MKEYLTTCTRSDPGTMEFNSELNRWARAGWKFVQALPEQKGYGGSAWTTTALIFERDIR